MQAHNPIPNLPRDAATPTTKTKAKVTMPTVGKEDEPLTPAQMAINAVKVFFALSPLLALFYVLLSGFESDDKENAKRIKKGFSLDGHGE